MYAVSPKNDTDKHIMIDNEKTMALEKCNNRLTVQSANMEIPYIGRTILCILIEDSTKPLSIVFSQAHTQDYTQIDIS